MRRAIAALCFTVALAALALPAHAQKVSVGLKAGPNFTTIKGNDAEETDSYARMIGGGFMVVELGSYLSLQPELLYAQKGAKMIDQGETFKLKVDYFEVPVLLRVHPANSAAAFLPHAIAGPTIAYKSSCKMASADVTVDCEGGQFALPLKDVDFGLALGAGVDMAVGRVFLGVDARYEFGLTKIDDADNPSDVKNRALSIMAGFRVPLGAPALSSLKF